jgi:hypothetical protein
VKVQSLSALLTPQRDAHLELPGNADVDADPCLFIRSAPQARHMPLQRGNTPLPSYTGDDARTGSLDSLQSFSAA